MKDNLIKRYVYDVTRRLPKSISTDIEKELTSNIIDMLPENYTDEQVYDVLLKMGKPSKLANNYRLRPRSLISADVYDEYLIVLKIVMPIVFFSLLMINLIISIFSFSNPPTIMEVLILVINNLFTSAFAAASNSFLWVTLVFVGIDYINYKKGGGKWTPKDLPQLNDNVKYKISQKEEIVNMALSIVFSIIFILVLFKFPYILVWNFFDNIAEPVLIFNTAVLKTFLLPFIIVALLSVGVSMTKLYYLKWNYVVSTACAIHSAVSAIVAVFFILNSNLFNYDFIALLSQTFEMGISEISAIMQKIKIVSVVVVIVITVFSGVSNFYKSYKASK